MGNSFPQARCVLGVCVALVAFFSARTSSVAQESLTPELAFPKSLQPAARREQIVVWIEDQEHSATAGDKIREYLTPDFGDQLDRAEQAQFQRLLTPRLELSSATPLPGAARGPNRQLQMALSGQSNLLANNARYGITLTGADIVSGREATVRSTSDAGNLLSKSPAAIGVATQSRNPVVTDMRVRSDRVGSTGASGSYWVPARIDLDTVLSKFDSRVLEATTVIKGPYSALFGPGFEFVDIELLRSPRYRGGTEAHGQSIVDYKTNGEQWYGRQNIWGGGSDWGFRAGYGHATGRDYLSGDNLRIPSGYKSRDANLTLGADLTEDSSVEFHYLRLDQTDVELAGQAFDIDVLKTDGYDIEYVIRDQEYYDQLLIESWYNRTQLKGSAQRSGKRAIFPYYDFIEFFGVTDVDSISTGYRTAFSWEGTREELLTIGADLRFIEQELNEITSGRIGRVQWVGLNSPIPESHASNPGVFAQMTTPAFLDSVITVGCRADWVSTNITDDPASLAAVGIGQPQLSAAEILGSEVFDQDDTLGAGFITIDRDWGDGWGFGGSFAYAERAPNVTERYAVEPFMFLLQNGLNTVTGDPLLDKERRLQFDLRASHETDAFRATVTGYYAWVHDYITFENLSTVTGPPNGNIVQTNLKYVNTELATLAGCEARGEYDLCSWMTPFATLAYVEGTDRTRNGSFATRQADAPTNSPSAQVPGMVRGAFSGVAGGAEEPLPSIFPLESRIGARLGPNSGEQTWGLEIYARVVDNQDRVAASLLESPTPGFTIWDLRAFWAPKDGVFLVAGVENFTDKAFREHLDFRSLDGIQVLRPGVSFYFGGECSY